jgi:hypothetical protein
MNLYELKHSVSAIVDEFIDENFKRVPAEQCGLDNRCGSIWVSNDSVAVQKGHGARMLDYYGGFEYVDAESRTEVGDWIFYDDSDERVFEALRYSYQSEAA